MSALLKKEERWSVVSKTTEELNQEWADLRLEMREQRLAFDRAFRASHQRHNCQTKVVAWNGDWFCGHMTDARNRVFKEQIEKADELICSMIPLIQ